MLEFSPRTFNIPREILKVQHGIWCQWPQTLEMSKFLPCTFNIASDMLKVASKKSLTWPKIREMFNKLNMLKVSPDYRPYEPLVRINPTIFNIYQV